MVHDNMKIEGRTIDIRIDNAKLSSLICTKKAITANINLLRGQDEIANHSMSNDSWVDKQGANYLEMTPAIMLLVEGLFLAVEKQVHYQLNVLGKMLPEGEKNEDEDEK